MEVQSAIQREIEAKFKQYAAEHEGDHIADWVSSYRRENWEPEDPDGNEEDLKKFYIFIETMEHLFKQREEELEADRLKEEKQQRKLEEEIRKAEKKVQKKGTANFDFFNKKEKKIVTTIKADNTFLKMFVGYTTIVGGPMAWERIAEWLDETSKDMRMKRIIACVIFHLKPNSLLILGQTKKMKDANSKVKDRVDKKIANYLPKITTEALDDMPPGQKARYEAARLNWGVFGDINRSMITRIGLLAEMYEPKYFPDLVLYNEKCGGKPDVRVLTASKGMTQKTIDIFEEQQAALLKARSTWDNEKFRNLFS
jgi:hypothetical protein